MDPNTFFSKILPIQDGALRARVVSLSQVRKLDKGAFLGREGETMTQISFLLSGILRGFFLDYNGRDITDCFGVRCGAPAVSTFRPDTPSPISIPALTDTQVLSIPMAEALDLLGHDVRLGSWRPTPASSTRSPTAMWPLFWRCHPSPSAVCARLCGEPPPPSQSKKGMLHHAPWQKAPLPAADPGSVSRTHRPRPGRRHRSHPLRRLRPGDPGPVRLRRRLDL